MIRFIACVWLGLVLGVSFLATPVKFRAESLTLPVAMDVGQATFHAFGKVEWALSALLAVLIGSGRSSLEPAGWFALGLIVAIVAAQALWLIPRLDVRVAAIMSGEALPPSQLHKVYIGAELAKALGLLYLGTWTASQA